MRQRVESSAGAHLEKGRELLAPDGAHAHDGIHVVGLLDDVQSPLSALSVFTCILQEVQEGVGVEGVLARDHTDAREGKGGNAKLLDPTARIVWDGEGEAVVLGGGCRELRAPGMVREGHDTRNPKGCTNKGGEQGGRGRGPPRSLAPRRPVGCVCLEWTHVRRGQGLTSAHDP
jgi:hypothetical protein